MKPNTAAADPGAPKETASNDFAPVTLDDLAADDAAGMTGPLEPFISAGITVLAGPPLVGKGSLALALAAALALGKGILDVKAQEQKRVLYIDTRRGRPAVLRRLQRLPEEERQAVAGNLRYEHRTASSATLTKDALEKMGAGECDLVVIDDVEHLKPGESAVTALRDWSRENKRPVLVVSTTRKVNKRSPSLITADANHVGFYADALLVMLKDGGHVTLHAYRDDELVRHVALESDLHGSWTVVGDAALVQLSEERRRILGVLEEADELMSPADIAIATEMQKPNVVQLLFKMKQKKDVVTEGKGHYRHPLRTELK